ncbi:Kelch motif family protein [Tritrichomonas foetus]|uniref:Kelch motif family protein n=1 Tax=Tritrichomonas foetus TaxID=1144522 RepID=A0A1J4KEG5_9EUKA|nr:Kelch motif family protein [Tritrichomonas foetus]|eukprot:OHT09839.1 Kelch motif family protein [Tritrichomonas foetus]
MGNNESQSFPLCHEPYAGSSMPFAYASIRAANLSVNLLSNCIPPSIKHQSFHGVWSIVSTYGAPEPRIGHFTVTDDDQKYSYIGYGKNGSRNFTDLWRLDLETLEWKEITLKGDVFSKRNGSRAAYYNNSLIVFGGFFDKKYTSEMYIIDINSGIVKKFETHGNIPSPRSSPVMAIDNEKLFIWGGYNGNYPNELNILDLKTLTWNSKDTAIHGRTSIPHVLIDHKIIGYGSSNNDGVLEIDTINDTVDIIPNSGSTPPPEHSGASMVAIGKYAIYYGGKSDDENTFMYAYDSKKHWWFIFHVLPDGETVTIADGHVTTNGLFMIPRIHSGSMLYSPKRKEIVCCMGSPIQRGIELSLFNVGTAFSVITQREDMSEMLKLQ